MQTVHVIGAGGIGVALGWFLARAGWLVTMVDVNPRKLAAGNQHGLELDSVPVREGVTFQEFHAWVPPTDALVLLCTKTYDNAAVLSRLPSRARLLPVQNGFDPELDASGHPLEGIASFVSECAPDRPTTRITRQGELYLGARRSLSAEENTTLAELGRAFTRGGCRMVRVVDRIAPYKFSKLMYNAAISPLAASAGVDNGELLGDPVARRLFFSLLRENYRILSRRGLPLARIGPFHPRVVAAILRIPGLARLLANFFRPGLAGTYCSMARDIRSARTEIAAYNGHLKSLAQGVDCPVNTAVLELISNMRDNHLPPGRSRLEEISASLMMGGKP